MLALVKTAPGPGLDLLEVADPTPGPGELLVQVEAAGVCGSDVARYTWTRNYDPGGAKAMTDDLPRVLGHEFAGTVVAAGSAPLQRRIGERVVIQNVLGCLECAECRVGLPNLCVRRRTIGVHRDGGYAERCVVPERNCTPIPDGMGFHLAASLQPFAVGTYAVEQAQLAPGDHIVVWGLGPVGLAVAHAARLGGAEVALGVDRSPVRIRAAQALGIPTLSVAERDPAQAILEALPRRSVDAVFEAAGSALNIAASLPVLVKRGPLVLIGNLHEPVHADLMPLIMDQQRLLGSRSYSLAAWDRAVRTIVPSGYERTLGDEVALDEALAHFAEAAAGRGRPFTIMPNGR